MLKPQFARDVFDFAVVVGEIIFSETQKEIISVTLWCGALLGWLIFMVIKRLGVLDMH